MPYLLEAFERLLKERIETGLAGLDEHDAEYRTCLEASLADLWACHAGYFSQDNRDSDVTAEGYSVKFRTQLGNKQMRQIINEVLA